MNKLLLLSIFLCSPLYAQELTADTPATIDWLAEGIKLLLVAFGMFLNLAAPQAIKLLNAYLKQIMHFRGASVVADALTEAIAEMSAEVQKALADGVITPEEKAALKLRARQIAESRLKNLSGFYKADLIGWIDDQLNIALAKILARI